MDKVAVIGAGLIGRGWASVFARSGHDVALYDRDASVLDQADKVIAARLQDLEAHGLVEEPESVRRRIGRAENLEKALDGAGYVQENVPETLEDKRDVFALVDALAPLETVLASSSSAIPASTFTQGLAGRERCLIAHPVNPPYLLPLVELVPAPWTDTEVVARARALMESVGQVPIVINREIAGFVLNRLQGALLGEAFRLVEDGYAMPEDVDKAVRDGLGLRWSFMGPFETIDLNSPGGVREYLRRYGDMFHRIGQSQCPPRRWREGLVAKVEAARRAVLPEDRLTERQGWRDRRLMALSTHKSTAERDIK